MKPYSIDPSLLSLEEFWELTAGKSILPGRIILQEEMKERFRVLKLLGVNKLGDLLRILSSKSKIDTVAVQTGLSTDYLVLLKREAGSYLARPFPLGNFPGIPFEYVELLKSRGILNTQNFFERAQTDEQQEELSLVTGIPAYRLKELSSLCDLSRITGVGAVFARVVYEAGIRSTREFASTDISILLSSCQAIIEKHGYAAGKLGEKDIQYGINYANVVVKYDQKSDNK
jgi:hypothetical protein